MDIKTHEKVQKIAQSLLDNMIRPRGIAYDFSEQFISIDSNNNFIINLFEPDGGYSFIARIENHWYKVNKFKNDWDDEIQVIEKIESIELNDSIEKEAIELIKNDFIDFQEGFENLLDINEIINADKTTKEYIKLSNENSKGEIVITNTVFGKIYGYYEDGNLGYLERLYHTLENDNELIHLNDILDVFGSVSMVDGNPKFDNADDEAKYQNYLRGKEIVFNYYNKHK